MSLEQDKIGQIREDIGGLKAKVELLGNDVHEVRNELKEFKDVILEKLNDINAVSRPEWKERNALVDTMFKHHDERIASIESYVSLENNSVFHSFRKKFSDRAIDYVIGILLAALTLISAYSWQASQQNKQTIKTIESEVKNER